MLKVSNILFYRYKTKLALHSVAELVVDGSLGIQTPFPTDSIFFPQ